MRRIAILFVLLLALLIPWVAVADSPTSLYLPLLAKGPPLLIAAAHIDSARSGEADEAILLWNVGAESVVLDGWQLESSGRRATVPAGTNLRLAPGARIWCAAEAAAFRQSFGEIPAFEWDADSDPLVPNLEGKVALPNDGGLLRLLTPQGAAADVLVYGDESRPAEGWVGPPAQAYTHGVVSAQGQVWQRKRDPLTGRPLDSNRREDWAGDLADMAWGRRVRWPGWQGWEDANWGRPWQSPAEAQPVTELVAAIGPEGLYTPIAQAMGSAQSSIDLSIYTLEHPQLALLLAERAAAGVRVRVLLDGAPPGGITPLQKWCVSRVAAAGADVRYWAMADGAPGGIKRRYRYVHAKYGILDGRLALVSTENFSRDSMPLPGAQPAGGRRGYALLTNDRGVVGALQGLFAADWAPERFWDLHPYAAADPKYGAPPSDYTLPPPRVYEVAAAPFAEPLRIEAPAHFMLVTAPENALRPDDGLLGLIAQAGAGDELVLEQLYEHRHWGPTASSPVTDPNPRLQALIEAARRGASVRIMLDSFFDEPEGPRSNAATVAYVRAIAASEGLDLQARSGNPTQGGIHAKLLLARVGGRTWSAVGSLNGGEVSHKLNREVVLLVDAAAVYDRLRAVFAWDWAAVGAPPDP